MTGNRRVLAGFCLRLIVGYMVLAAPWPGLAAVYSRIFATCFDYMTYGVFEDDGLFGTDAMVRLYPIADDDWTHDLQLVIGNRSTKALTDRPRASSRHLGYVPAIVLLCLVLATPLSRSRRLSALLWGELWVHVFIAIRVGLALAYAFHGDHPYCVYSLGPVAARALFLAYDVVSAEPVISYVVPVLIWVTTAFRGEDLARFADAERANVAS